LKFRGRKSGGVSGSDVVGQAKPDSAKATDVSPWKFTNQGRVPLAHPGISMAWKRVKGFNEENKKEGKV